MSDQTGEGHELHSWKDGDGVLWVCAAYDHGPFCRLCTRVDPADDTLKACLANVIKGLMVVRTLPDGELSFKITEKGHERVQDLLVSDADAQRIYEIASLDASFEASPDTREPRGENESG